MYQPWRIAAAAAIFAVLHLALCVHGQDGCTKIYNVTGTIQFASAGIDACWLVQPFPADNVGEEYTNIMVTVNAYDLGLNRADIYNTLSVSEKTGVRLATLSGADTTSTSYTATAGVFFIYFTSADATQAYTFSISWDASASGSFNVSAWHTHTGMPYVYLLLLFALFIHLIRLLLLAVRGVFSLGLFVGTSIAVLLPIMVACVVKFTLRKRFTKKLPTTMERQRINPDPPKKEQIIVWISVAIGLILFILFTQRIIPT
jgi:hypothetical protein